MSLPYIISKLEWLSSTISTINGAIDINRANIAVLSADTHKRLNDLEASRATQRTINGEVDEAIASLLRANDVLEKTTKIQAARIKALEEKANYHADTINRLERMILTLEKQVNSAPGDRPLFKVTVEEIK